MSSNTVVLTLQRGKPCCRGHIVRRSWTLRPLFSTWVFCWSLLYFTALLPLSASLSPPAEASAKAARATGRNAPAVSGAGTGVRSRGDADVAAAVAEEAAPGKAGRVTTSPSPASPARKGDGTGALDASAVRAGETPTGKPTRTRTVRETVGGTEREPARPAVPTGALNETAGAAAAAAAAPRGVPASSRKSPRAARPGPTPPSPAAGGPVGRHFNFTLAFLTAVQNKGPGKFTAGAFFLALEHLNNATEERLQGSPHSATFGYVFRDTLNEEQTATRAMVDLYCSEDEDVSAFIGPDVFCNSAALLATSFDLPYLSFDCNDIHTLRTNIHKFLMVNLEPSLAYVAKSIVALMKHYGWTSFWLITGTGATNNAWIDTGQELRHHMRKEGITLIDTTREGLNDRYHTIIKEKQPYRTIIEETRYKTRVYVFLGDYNSLVAFLQELESAGVTSAGEHVVIAVDDEPLLGTELDDSPGRSNYFLSLEDTGQEVTPSRLAAFRNVLLLTRQEPTNNITEEFRYHVYERNYAPPIQLQRIPPWWPGKKRHDLKQESVYMYDAVMHYGNVVIDLIKNGQDPYNASLVTQRMRNLDIDSVQGFKIHINQDGESEGRYVVRGLACDELGQPIDQLWKVGWFSMYNGTPVFQPSNLTYFTWVNGRVPVSDPECGFDGSKCGGDAGIEEWKLIAVGIGLAVMALLVIGAVFVGLRYWLMVRRMRRQALAAARVGCTNSFMELQEQDREGLLVC